MDKAAIPGYEGLYEIHINGLVWSVKRGKYLKGSNKQGYYTINLSKNGKYRYFRAHRLIAWAFIPNPENKPYINHKNGVKDDNRVENLEWCTGQENIKHAFQTGLIKMPTGVNNSKYGKVGFDAGRSRPVHQIHPQTGEIIKTYGSCCVAAKSMNVVHGAIHNCCRGNSKISAGFKWQYANKIK